MKSELSRLATIITELKPLTPTNLQEEKKKFFESDDYNPQFTYEKTDFPIEAFNKTLESYLQKPQAEDEKISRMIQERVRELQTWLAIHQHKGTAAFGGISTKLFGNPTTRFLQAANETIKQPVEEETKRPLGAKEAKEALEKALKEEGIDWPVRIIEGLFSRVSVIQGKELRVAAQAKFSEKDLKKLIIHEIKTHCKRHHNASKQEQPIFETGTAKYIETEEGLATYNEEKAGYLDARILRNHAARVLAVDAALKGSFRKTYELLKEKGVPEEKAFEITTSVKRGMGDTSKPGAFNKPMLYYTGYLKIKALPKEDLKYLYIGKVSIEHLPIIKTLIKEGKARLEP